MVCSGNICINTLHKGAKDDDDDDDDNNNNNNIVLSLHFRTIVHFKIECRKAYFDLKLDKLQSDCHSIQSILHTNLPLSPTPPTVGTHPTNQYITTYSAPAEASPSNRSLFACVCNQCIDFVPTLHTNMLRSIKSRGRITRSPLDWERCGTYSCHLTTENRIWFLLCRGNNLSEYVRPR
jgi:hypothetical protein